MKRKAEEHDGWELAKENKRSFRMQRAKPEGRQLEDDVWSLFYRMGFKEMNADRSLMMTGKDGTSRRQLDVFAKDDETVFIVECTHSRDGGAKSIKGLLDRRFATKERRPRPLKANAGSGRPSPSTSDPPFTDISPGSPRGGWTRGQVGGRGARHAQDGM